MNKIKKKVLLFDVDGTLTNPMQPINDKMITTLRVLQESQKYVLAIVGGSDYTKIKKQLGNSIHYFDHVFTQNGLEYYKGDVLQDSTSISKHFGEEGFQNIINIILLVICNVNIPKKRGTFIEYRTGMLNVSPIGRNCSQLERDEFELYDIKTNIRKQVISELKNELSRYNLQFSIGGQISFDVFPQGWDKTYCLRYLDNFSEIHFFGDKCYPGGNDYELFIHPSVHGHSIHDYENTISILKEYF